MAVKQKSIYLKMKAKSLAFGQFSSCFIYCYVDVILMTYLVY